MKRQWVLVWSLGSAALLAIGAFGPWVTALGILSVSGPDVHRHGWYLAALALAGGLAVFARRSSGGAGVWAIVVGLAGAALTFHDRESLTAALAGAGTTDLQRELVNALVHVGWGLNVALAASISLALSGSALLLTGDEGRPAQVRLEEVARPRDAAAPSVPRIAAGWYKDPTDASLLRYWNGFGWTTRTAKPASQT